jgi:hypothetical protein
VKTYKLEIWPHSLELMGSVADNDDAAVSVLRVNVNEYENGDEQMIRRAFDFATALLQPTFPNMHVAKAFVSVEYDGPIDEEPHQIVTANRIHRYLNTLGYRRKT